MDNLVAATAEDHASLRRTMVDCQIRTFNVTNFDVIAAFEATPRHPFVAPAFADVTYSDRALPALAAGGRPMMAPLILARLLEAALIGESDKALVVAGGGYSAAIMARLAGDVTLLEEADLDAAVLQRVLAEAGAERVAVVTGPLEQGHAAGAPYDVILVEGLIGQRPDTLLDQLAEGGRLIAVERLSGLGRAVVYTRSGADFGRAVAFDGVAPELPPFHPEPVFSF